MSDKLPGSTLIPESTLTPTVQTQKVTTDQLSMGGVTADGIVTDNNDTDPKKLVTSYALHKASNELNSAMDSLSKVVNDFIFAPVLSEAIASPHFVDLSKWQRQGWMIDNGLVFYANNKPLSVGQAILRLAVDAFLHPGHHYLEINATEIPAGSTLTVVDYHDTVILEITAAGVYKAVFDVDHPGTYYLDFRADYMEPGTQMTIDSISVHRLKPEFESYMDYAAMMQVSGGHGFATMDQIQAELNNVRNAIQSYVNTAVNTLRETLSAHINDRDTNPHGVSTGMIHAAADDHTHDFTGFTGMTDMVLQPLKNISTQLAAVSESLSRHLSANNPHKLTPATIGAAEDQHNHPISDIKQLQQVLDSLDKKLSESQDTQFNDIAQQIASVNSTINQLAQSYQDFEAYVNETIDCAPESLGVIFATPAEAQEGVRDDRYMSPALTRECENAWAAWKDVDITRRYGKGFGRFLLTAANPFVTLEINSAGLYQIVLTGDSNWDIRTLRLTCNGTYSNTSSILAGVKAGDAATVQEALTDNTLKFLPGGSDITRAFGVWTFLPEQMALFGNGVGYQGTGLSVTGGPIALCTHSGHVQPGKQNNLSTVTVSVLGADENTKVELFLHELVGTQEHSLATDAHPAGTIVERFGTKPMRDYSLFDGSVLRRDIYEDLYKYAAASGAMITQAAWDAMVASVGYCESFHSGDGSTTFGLPKLDNSGPINKFIKLKNTFLANPGQLFFEYVWRND